MPTENEKYTNIQIKNLDNSEVEVTGEIPFQTVATHRPKALKHLSNTFTIDGFRQGHIPENVLIAKVGEIGILEEMANEALGETFVAIIEDKNIKALGRPHITITKLAPQNPVGFRMLIATMPEINLPEYKEIAQTIMSKKEEVIVEQKEIDDATLQIRKAVHHHRQSGILGPDGKPLPSIEIPDTELPPLDDAMVKSIGDFKDTADFTTKLTENIKTEKAIRAKEKKRAEILEKILQKTTFRLPRLFVESELAKMFAQFEGDVARAGISFEEYLKQIKKTPDDLRKEWLPDAEGRARGELILHEIAEKEQITVPEHEIKEATDNLMKRHKDVSEENIRDYVRHILTNSKVFEFLENIESP
ncbi:MAG: trigger factor [Parcubacteria group bacterium Gr01-1014_48]|nr:MAG: trigger factor [Parcubacteria group bacterium Greene0416_14]TSC73496.1 MAG: trigger factor [Parcubacteria group bacterium Gr01-1014_48]TSD01229.1 MAG: trigger factor [Parcubacteria group bacterium Greene1014_15]TSD08306.1 MAG: trigger factor [Parcubacteria group bacterium Greene0714_4]